MTYSLIWQLISVRNSASLLIPLKSSEEGRILSLVPGVEKNFDQKLSQSERIGRRFLPSDIAGSSRLNLRIFYLLDPPRYNMDCVSCVRLLPLGSAHKLDF